MIHLSSSLAILLSHNNVLAYFLPFTTNQNEISMTTGNLSMYPLCDLYHLLHFCIVTALLIESHVAAPAAIYQASLHAATDHSRDSNSSEFLRSM